MKPKDFAKTIFRRVNREERVIMRNIFEYVQNDHLSKVMDLTNTDEYRYLSMLKKLTSVFIPINNDYEYTRVGRDNDGGYVMVANGHCNYSRNKIAYSFGISDDVSWDMEMARGGL